MAYTPRDRYNDEVAAVAAAVARGEVPYNSAQGAFDFIYNNYGIPAGVSYQEAGAAIGDAFKSDWLPADQSFNSPTQDMSITPTGGGTAASTKFPYKGVTYDSANPSSMAQLKAIRDNELSTANSDLQSQYQRNFGEVNQTYGDQLNTFNSDLNKYNTGKDDYTKQLSDLYEGFGQGNVARQNYFTKMSPGGYQSGEGSSADYANTKYQQGYSETNAARNEYGANLNQGKERLGQNYQYALDDNRKALADALSANNQQYNDASYGTFGNTASYNGFTPVADVKANQVDLSQYTPYTNFQGLQGSAGANMFKKFTPTQSQDPLAQTLGYSLPTKASDPKNSYLYSR